MDLSKAILEGIANKNKYDVEAINKLEGVGVEQHKQRAIVENMINYPSLIKELAYSVENEGIKYVDVEYVKNALRSKPHWIRVGKATLKLMINN
jgi:hypothetical protein